MRLRMTAFPTPAIMAFLLLSCVPFGSSFGQDPLGAVDGLLSLEEDVQVEDRAPTEQDASPEDRLKEEPLPQLTPELAALRDAVRRSLAATYRQPFNTADNTPADLFRYCMAFGPETEVHYGASSGEKINGLGCLCWNYPCAGYRLLRAGDDTVMARVGYGLQTRPGEFLAILAQSMVPIDYRVRTETYEGTVADLVAYEQRHCRSGTDLSFALIGLSSYVDEGKTWKSDLEEEWSIERMVKEELARSATSSGNEVTDRLMGLSWAVKWRRAQDLPVEGPFCQAEDHIEQFHEFALKLQNSDGSWHPAFFARRGTSTDAVGTLRSTGHILRWLAFSLPKAQLHDPRVVQAVGYVGSRLGSQSLIGSLTARSAQHIDAVTYAAHALMIYDARVFEPFDPEPNATQSDAEPAGDDST